MSKSTEKANPWRIFESFSVGEKTIAITSIVFFLVPLTVLALSLSSFYMSEKNENILNTSAVMFNYGKKYSYDSCFTCTPATSSTEAPNMEIKNKFNLQDPSTQGTFLNTPITLGNVYFPKPIYQALPSVWSNDWFDSKIRLNSGSNIILTEHLLTNSINSLQVGYFDYINNKTGICVESMAIYSTMYYAIDPSLGVHYVCICIMNPQFATEGCMPLTIPGF